MDENASTSKSTIDYLCRQKNRYWLKLRRFLRPMNIGLRDALRLVPRPPVLWNYLKYSFRYAEALMKSAVQTLPKCLWPLAGRKLSLQPSNVTLDPAPARDNLHAEPFTPLNRRVSHLDSLVQRRNSEILSHKVRKEKREMRDWLNQNLNPGLPRTTLSDADLAKLSLGEVYSYCLTTAVEHGATLSKLGGLHRPAGITLKTAAEIIELESKISIQRSTVRRLPNEIWEEVYRRSKFHLDIPDGRDFTYKTEYFCNVCRFRIYERNTKKLKHVSCLCSSFREQPEVNSSRVSREPIFRLWR
jgi:hypothetical protein